MFSFTVPELASFYEQVIVNVASKLEISNAIWKSRGELEIEIRNKDQDIFKLLSNFLDAYQKWYDFSYNETGQGKEIAAGKNEQFIELLDNRDKTRNVLLKQLES